MGERKLDIKIFTRITRTTKTPEGLQKSNISIFEYDNEEIAYSYFKDIISEEQWKNQLETGEGFYLVKTEDHENTIFLETRSVIYKNV